MGAPVAAVIIAAIAALVLLVCFCPACGTWHSAGNDKGRACTNFVGKTDKGADFFQLDFNC